MAQPLIRLQEAATKLGKTTDQLTVADLMGQGWKAADAVKFGAKNETTTADLQNVNQRQATAATTPASIAGTLAGATAGGTIGTAVKTATQTLGDALKERAAATTQQAPATATAPTPPQTQAPAPQTPQAPQTGSFQYQPSTRTESQLLAAARARAQMLIGTRRQEAEAQYAQGQELARQHKEGLNRQMAGYAEKNRANFAARGLNVSGFHAGANSLGQAVTQQEVGKVNAQEELARRAKAAEMNRLAELQGSAEVANLDQLEQMERNFGLQERAQQFGEYNSNRQYNLQATDLGSILAQRAFALERGQVMLPYELQGAGLANQQSAFNLYRGQSLLPGEIQGQGIGNQTAQFNLDSARQMQPIQQQAAQLANERTALTNKMALLDYQIANDPDVGSRQQAIQAKVEAEQKMRLVEAQIAQVNAETANIGKTGGVGGLTAYQQYQIDTDLADRDKKARESRVNQYTKVYDITPFGPEAWIDLNDELDGIRKATGSIDRNKAAELMQGFLSIPGLTNKDKTWVAAMFAAKMGDAGAAQHLRTFLKNYTPGPTLPDDVEDYEDVTD